MEMKLLLLLILFTIIAMVIAADQQLEKDAAILHKCLTYTIRPTTLEQMRKIVNYASWTKEEIPCFTRCISAEKGWFDIDTSKWNKQRIVDELGSDMYNYCRYELDRPFENVCDFAHKGLRCLKQAEIHMSKTYKNLLLCANELGANLELLQKYSHFPAQEEIPCLFACFAEKMDFYRADYSWNFDNWLNSFGPVRHENIDPSICKASTEQMKQMNKCAWMYEEYMCLERLNYNTDGSPPRLPAASTTMSMKKCGK